MDDRQQIAAEFGIDQKFVTDHLIRKIADDPSTAFHIEACKHDEAMLSILAKFDPNSSNQNSNQSLLRQAWNNTLQRSSIFSTIVEFERRKSVCLTCEHCQKLTLLGERHSCGLCGCVIEWKARLLKEECPDLTFGRGGRWS